MTRPSTSCRTVRSAGGSHCKQPVSPARKITAAARDDRGTDEESENRPAVVAARRFSVSPPIADTQGLTRYKSTLGRWFDSDTRTTFEPVNDWRGVRSLTGASRGPAARANRNRRFRGSTTPTAVTRRAGHRALATADRYLGRFAASEQAGSALLVARGAVRPLPVMLIVGVSTTMR